MEKTILHIAPTPFFSDRGCHIRIEGIVRCLTQLEYNNTVCTYHHGREVTGVSTKRIKAIASYTQTAAGPSKHKLLADWRLLILSIQQYRVLKPDVIHAHLHEGLLIGLLIKYLFFWRMTPVFGDMQGSLSGELTAHGSFEKKPFLKWPVIALEWLLMKSATHIICSSQHSLDKIQKEFSINADKISLAQDGADPIEALTEKRRNELLKHWQLPNNKILIVYSGALLDSKGLTELKKVIKETNSKDAHFLIIGYPTENLVPFLEQEQLQEKCTLTGQIDFASLGELLSLADVAIEPKNNEAGEGSGKMLNYLAARLPVAAFNTVNNNSFLPAQALLAKDTNELISQLEQLISEPELRDSAGKNNYKRFTEQYSWQNCQTQLDKIYQRLLNKK